MADSNPTRPDPLPDMSLDKRDEAPAPAKPIPAWDVPTSYQAKPVGEPSTPKPSGPRVWRRGDRVLAPWEPMFLYPGVIRRIIVDEAKGDQAEIDFDDGGEGIVFLFALCPIEINVGQDVQVRRLGDPTYHPGEILEVAGEDIHVKLISGETEWTTLTSLRIPCIENSPGAIPTKNAPWQPPPPDPNAGSGVPSWVWTIGIIVLLAFVRIGCRAINH